MNIKYIRDVTGYEHATQIEKITDRNRGGFALSLSLSQFFEEESLPQVV